MDKKDFLNLSNEAIAELIQAAKTEVVVFPINGTRRWYFLEHPPQATTSPQQMLKDYMDIAGQRHIELYKLFFEHGIRVLLTPVFGKDLLHRGQTYVHMALAGTRYFVEHPDFLAFYKDYDVGVRFYGEYRKFFAGTPFEAMSDLLDSIAETTKDHRSHSLLIGVCAEDSVSPVVDLTLDFYQQHGRKPSRDEIITAYYGEYIPPANIFVGFDKFAIFDYPLLQSGLEDLYFTVTPSMYLDRAQLRELLYDHLYARRIEETDYEDMSAEDWDLIRQFYQANQGKTQGVGGQQAQGNYWYPQAQVVLPPHFERDS